MWKIKLYLLPNLLVLFVVDDKHATISRTRQSNLLYTKYELMPSLKDKTKIWKWLYSHTSTIISTSL